MDNSFRNSGIQSGEGPKSSNSTLQPITREFLREFYKAYPIDPFNEEVTQLRSNINSHIDQLMSTYSQIDFSKREASTIAPPKHMDHNMYINRWQCEEIVNVVKKLMDVSGKSKLSSEKLEKLADSAERTRDMFLAFQNHQRDHVNRLVAEFLPNDFRVSLLQGARERKEKRYADQVDQLIQQGGSLKEKYDLLWQQQWERRQSLADLGAASGMWKVIIKYVAGCPEVLLDFARQINAPIGPTEEMRILYGPHLYELTRISCNINVLGQVMLLIGTSGNPTVDLKKSFDVMENAVSLYSDAAKEYLSFMEIIVEKSPIFVSADAIASAASKSNPGDIYPYEEFLLAARDSRKITAEVEGFDADSETEFLLYYEIAANRDVKFGVEASNGKELVSLDTVCQRGTHEMGCVKVSKPSCVFIFDNLYSRITKKSIRYRYAFLEQNAELPKWIKELKDAGFF
mmetsp:Transcript_2747/g.4821  ORF Transcript_2747/g.4821 Transcript_2747/m.4821 type:complete len:458 (-) Transcript_2747:117-1490(-)